MQEVVIKIMTMTITAKHKHVRREVKLTHRCYLGYRWLFQENHSGDAVLKCVQSFQGHCEGQGHIFHIHGIRTSPSFLGGIFLRVVCNARSIYTQFFFPCVKMSWFSKKYSFVALVTKVLTLDLSSSLSLSAN